MELRVVRFCRPLIVYRHFVGVIFIGRDAVFTHSVGRFPCGDLDLIDRKAGQIGILIRCVEEQRTSLHGGAVFRVFNGRTGVGSRGFFRRVRQRNLVIDAAVCQAKHITWLCCSADIQRSRDLFCGLRGSCRAVRICARDAHRGFARSKAGKRQGERAVCVQLDIVLTALDDLLLHAVVIDSNLPSERLFGLGKQLLVVCVLYGQRDRIGVAGINRNVRRRSLQLERCRNFDCKARDVIAELRLCDDRADILPDECDIVAVILTIIRNAADCCCGLIVCEFVSVFVVQLDFRRLCARIYIAAGDKQMCLQKRLAVFIVVQSAVFSSRFDIRKQVELLGIFFP